MKEQARTDRPAAPRNRKLKKLQDVQQEIEFNPNWQQQGMSSAWMQFYAKVKQVTQKS